MNSSLKSKNKNSLFSRIFYNNRYCWLAFGCSCAIMLVVYICYSLIPFGDVTILRMDLYHQYGPLYAELYDRITNLESFLYSWNTGLGSSFLGNFYNYLCSPLSLIILIFGHENMPEAIAAIILLQAAFSSASFCFYLKKSFGEHSFATAGFGVLYSFCGFFIAYYWNVMWLDAMVLFPLMILGIERIITVCNYRIVLWKCVTKIFVLPFCCFLEADYTGILFFNSVQNEVCSVKPVLFS